VEGPPLTANEPDELTSAELVEAEPTVVEGPSLGANEPEERFYTYAEPISAKD
jgi:hypothetical protein